MIRIEQLSFDYPGVRALDRVTAEVPAGTIAALVGPNGAGKSTLMRCIAGLDLPVEGRVVLDGIHVAENPRAARARLGFLPDLFGLYDRLSVRRCLAWAGASRGLAWDEAWARIPDLAARLGIAELLDRRAGELSRGQRQRVAIGQAIVHRPGTLVLDEPASGLDPEARIALAGLLRALCADGMTLLVSSHILAELAEYATHLLILDTGRVISCGPLAASVRRIAVSLAAEDARAASLLEAMPGVTAVDTTGATGLGFAFDGGDDALAEVLRRLVMAGIPVARFGPETASLQDVYLDRLREGRRA